MARPGRQGHRVLGSRLRPVPHRRLLVLARPRPVGPGTGAALLAAGFATLAAVVEAGGTLGGDRRVLEALHDRVGRTGQPVLRRIAELTDLPGLAVVAVVAVVGLLLAGRSRAAVAFAVGVGVVWLLNPLLKGLFRRPRPDLWPGPVPGPGLSLSEFSFPSGHAANTAALVAGLVLALPAGRWRVLASLVGATALVVVGVSQLALGVHYPSDIVAGWLLAGACVAGVRAVSVRRARRVSAGRS